MRLQLTHVTTFILMLATIPIACTSLKQSVNQPICISPQIQVDTKNYAGDLFKQGIQQYKDSSFQEAIESWKQALACYQELQDLKRQGKTLVNIGTAYFSLKNYDRAIEAWQQALSLFQYLKDLDRQKIILRKIGDAYYRLNKYDQVIEIWQQALKLYQKGEALEIQALLLRNIGVAHGEQGDYEQAIKRYKQSLKKAREIHDEQTERKSLINLGYVYLSLGKYEQAITYNQQALNLARKNNDPVVEANALGNLGSAYEKTCDYDKPILEYYENHLAIARKIANRKIESDALGNLGNFYLGMGDLSKALDYHQQNLEIAQEIANELGNRRGEANALSNIGRVYHLLAYYNKAENYHKKRLKLAREIGDNYGIAKTLGALGSVYYRLGRYTEAIKNHRKHLENARQIEDLQGQVHALGNLGNDYNALGKPMEAREHLQEALVIARKIDDCRSEIGAHNGIGLAYMDFGSYQQAVQKFQQSLELAQKHQDERQKGHITGNLGSTYILWGIRDKNPEYYKTAIEYYQQKLEIVRKNNDFRSEGAVLTNMGIAHTQLGDYQAATESFKQARQILQDIGDRDAYGQALAGTAFLHQKLGDTDLAIVLYKEAIEIKESIRSQLMVGAFKSSFEERQIDTYEQIIKLLWDRGDKEEAFNYVERARAKTFLDRLADGKIDFRTKAEPELLELEQALEVERIATRKELIALKNLPDNEQDKEAIAKLGQDLTKIETEYTNLLTQIELQHPEVASLVSLQPRKLLSLAQIQQKLNNDTTLIEYFVTEDRTFAFIITCKSFDSIDIEVSQDELKNSLRLFRQFANIRRPHPTVLQKLHKWLIEPLQKEHLHSSPSNLIIVPHGILHYLPFAALTDGEKYLIDTYNLSTLPSANVLDFLGGKQSHKKELPILRNSVMETFLSKLNNFWNFLWRDRRLNNKILILGNPVTPLPRLENAAREAQAIAKMYKTKAFLEQEATESILRSRAEESEIVHLAAHGEYNNRNPLFSTIHLAEDKPKGHDGRLEVHEVYGLNLKQATLVVLSACETNIGDLSQGDELVGLNRAFIYAQTPTVIASLWNVDDESTRILMEQFYTYLRKGMDKAKALREAQKEVRKEYPHPYFWAAFSLTGDGGKL